MTAAEQSHCRTHRLSLVTAGQIGLDYTAFDWIRLGTRLDYVQYQPQSKVTTSRESKTRERTRVCVCVCVCVCVRERERERERDEVILHRIRLEATAHKENTFCALSAVACKYSLKRGRTRLGSTYLSSV